MANSIGVSTREIDLTAPGTVQPTGIPAGVIGATSKGPAFVPTTVATPEDFVTTFGISSDDYRNAILASDEWLQNAQALTFLRVLGCGTGLTKTTSGVNAGSVVGAGFVVGNQQPQDTLGGNLGTNPYAVSTGVPGRTYFLGCFMSQSSNSTHFSDAGITTAQGKSVPIVRGVLMAPSGVLLTLSSAFNCNSAPLGATAVTEVNIRGWHTGSVYLNSGKQEFVMLLNGHRGLELAWPAVLTASFDPTAQNYFGKIFNRDPQAIERAGHCLYSYFDVYSSIAVVTGSGLIMSASGANASANAVPNQERVAFLLSGSLTRNSGSTTVPNFENFEDRYTTAKSPYVISQKFGGSPKNLFQVCALDDGEYPNAKYKISIENIKPSSVTSYLYGTFDLVVRDYNDNDNNKVLLEQWRGLTIDPNSPKFFVKVIGDYHTFYNFDSLDGYQKLQVDGNYPNNSKFIRVSATDEVMDGEIDATALPMGFRGFQHLVTSGSAPLPSMNDAAYLTVANVWNQAVTPPVPLRQNFIRGASPNQSTDKNLYWGAQLEKVTSALEPNISYATNSSFEGYLKYYPNFQTTWMDTVADNNEGAADTVANGILDADRFCNNMFSLERVKVRYNTTSGLADTTYLVSWSYTRNGNITADATNYYKALDMTDMEDATVRSVAKFTFCLYGGFDGTRIFNKETRTMTNQAVKEENDNAARGGSNGSTSTAFNKALSIMNDTSEVDIQLLTVPGIRHHYITDNALNTIESDRFDAMLIFDIEDKDVNGNFVSSSNQIVSVKNTTLNFNDRGLDSSFGAAYFPDVLIRDKYTRTVEQVPPSVAILGAFAKNDALAHPWYAPAGFARGTLNSVNDTTVWFNKQNLDDLNDARINPITGFGGQETVVWGQKTVYGQQTDLERVNVRRLLISLRREVKGVAQKVLWEPQKQATIDSFRAAVTPILKRYQDQKGLERYKLDISTDLTSDSDIANKTIKGIIYLTAVKSLEVLSLDFVLTNRGNFNLQG